MNPGMWLAAFLSELLCTLCHSLGLALRHVGWVVSTLSLPPFPQDLAVGAIDNSYSAVAQADYGRIYVVFGANLDNVTSLPEGQHISRTDGIGYFVARWSDDGGETYIKEKLVLPYRLTAIDRGYSWQGKVNQFWNVDQFKTRKNPDNTTSAYFMFTKVSAYDYVCGEEGARALTKDT